MVRTLAAAAALVVLGSFITPAGAFAQDIPPPPPPPPAAPPAPPPMPPQAQPPPTPIPGKMQHLRFYAGAAGVNQVSSGSGGAGILGIQSYGDIFPVLQWYWGAELIGVSVGTGFLALVDGDIGLRVTPFPDWPLRPYVRANLGLSVVVVIPVPSAGVAAGVILPIFNTVFLDIAFGARRVYYIFNTQLSIDLGLLELSIGF